MSRFDQAASKWDTPQRIELATSISKAMKNSVTFSSKQSVMDLGAGTGLICLEIAQHVKQVTAVDSSEEMLRVLLDKARSAGANNIDTVKAELGSPELTGRTFDIIISSMTLHHIKDISDAAKMLFGMLNASGKIALADLDSENGDFHQDNEGVHHFGFDRSDLQNIFDSAGFKNIRFYTATVMKKSGRDYPVFLMTAEK